MTGRTGDLPRDELVEHGRAVLDWIADYLEYAGALSGRVARPAG